MTIMMRSRGGGHGDGDGRDGSEPRLLRFLGRPNDTTPKALAKMMLGHPLPFDRHDWVVDRGGDEVRRYRALKSVETPLFEPLFSRGNPVS